METADRLLYKNIILLLKRVNAGVTWKNVCDTVECDLGTPLSPSRREAARQYLCGRGWVDFYHDPITELDLFVSTGPGALAAASL